MIPWFVGNAMGKPKGRAGFLYGFFLGWLGILILALAQVAGKRLRYADTR